MSLVEVTLHGEGSSPRSVTGFPTVCRDLYQSAFPPEQRLDPEIVAATVATGDRRLYLVHRDSVTRGFAVVFPVARDVVLLEYLAVEQDWRSLGLGSVLLGSVWDAEIARGASALYLEVEDPAEPGLAEDALDQRRRRVEFYRRNDAHPLPWRITYSAPSLGFTADHPHYALLARWKGEAPSFSEATQVLAAIARYSYTPPYTAPPM